MKLLRFLHARGFGDPVLVLDSSNDAAFAENAGCIATMGPMRIRHLRFPSDTFFYEKLHQGALQVEGEFAAMCADDDIIVPESIDQLVAKLESDPGYSYAHGITTRFWVKGDGEAAIDLEYRPVPYEQTSPLQRLQSLHSRVESTVWSVYRTGALREVLDCARSMGTYLFGEMATMTLALVLGKAAALPVVLTYRSCEPFAEPISRWHPVYWVLRDMHEFRIHYERYRNRLADRIVERIEASMSRTDVVTYLDICFLWFFCPQWDSCKGKVLEQLHDLEHGPVAVQEVPRFAIYRPRARKGLHRALQRLDSSLRSIVEGVFRSRSDMAKRFVFEGQFVAAQPALCAMLDREALRVACADLAKYLQNERTS